MVPGPQWPEESPGGSRRPRLARPRPGRGVAARKNAADQGGAMQRRKQKEGRERRGLAPPPPDPRHPEAVLDTVARAAGIDVHKMSLTCTVLVEDASGRVESETRQYRTYGAELHLLVDWLAGRDLARVVMESTGVFWKAVQRALAEAGVAVWVVNARHVKRVPGRKTDVSDSQWLATLARYGLVNPSFLAPPQLEDLRRLTRLYARMRRVASTLRNMLHRMLDESGLRIGGILTDLFGLSGRNLLDGLVAGRDPEQMMAGVKGKARKKIPALLDALGKGLDEGAKPLVVLLRDMLDAVERSLADLERRILDAVKRDYELPWTLLQTLPGTGPLAAATLLAEVGDDMDAFGTARRLASWAGMCPGNHESAGKSKGGKRRKGNVYLRRILCEVAHAAARTRDVQFGPYKQGLAIRRGTGRAVVATAHKILRIVFAMLRDGQPYRDPQVDYQARTAIKNKARWLKMLRKANLLQEVAKEAAAQLRGAPDGARAGPPPAGAAPEPASA